MIFLNLFLVVVYCRYASSRVTEMEKYPDFKQVNSYNTGNFKKLIYFEFILILKCMISFTSYLFGFHGNVFKCYVH